MNLVSAFHLITLGSNLGLGFGVYRTNAKRATNQLFLVLSMLLALWLASLAVGFVAHDTGTIVWWMRSCHGVASFFPLAFEWMRLAIIHPKDGTWAVIRRDPLWLAIALIMATLSFTPWIVAGASFPPLTDFSGSRSIPEPLLGPAFPAYASFYVLSLGLLVWRFYRSIRTYEGMRRAELQFILLGSGFGIVVAFWFIILVPMMTGSSQTARLGPISVVVLDGVIAYGIATRRIMDVAYVFRMMTAYTLLTGYLVALYALVWQALRFALRMTNVDGNGLAHLVAAIAVAFALAPVNGRMQRFANKLFIRVAPLDVGTVANHASQLLQSISTVGSLLKDFADIVTKTVDTDRVLILLATNGGFEQRFPESDASSHVSLAATDPVPQLLKSSRDTFVPDIVRRLHPNDRTAEACSQLDAVGISVAVGLRSKEGVEGLLLLGPRLSGRIYGAPEQQMLQLLADQLAVALNNAWLYTQVQDAKIYSDILVDNLASGVIAADNSGMVTVLNREAQRITRQDPATVLKSPSSILPPTLATMLSTTLGQGYGLRNHEVVLRWPTGDETPLRVSSSVFYGHSGKILGAFLVLSDLTAVKQLELQVRRTDRLASLGTLAAGMAHEIKNPLVSIKTFTQLLPERYEDADFRDTFFSLVGGEVKRIDGIVNQLLRFSRPAKPNLVSTSLHDILENSLKLMSQQLRHKDIRLVRSIEAVDDGIRADGDQLSQALINFLLNAIEAMTQGGTLTVRTAGPTDGSFSAAFGADAHVRYVTVSIHDTGEGIPAESIPRIFDPFFTTKSQGTGLGLSVAHGIIQEHHGFIDVKSDPGRGTTFLIAFPLMKEAERV